MVTSIHSRQLKNKIQLETRKQDESCRKIQDTREREKSSSQGKKSEEKEQKSCFEEEIVHPLFQSNTNIVVEKHLIRNFIC